MQNFQRMILEKQLPIIWLYSPCGYTRYWGFVEGIVRGAGDTARYNLRVWLDK